VVAIAALIVALPIFAQSDEDYSVCDYSKQKMMIRPSVLDTDGECLSVAEEGQYNVSIGTIIEIDYTFIWWPPCPEFISHCIATNNYVIKKHSISPRTIMPGTYGAATTVGYFYKAIMSGDSDIVLYVNDRVFTYHIHVY
jgi:hypothetical protein